MEYSTLETPVLLKRGEDLNNRLHKKFNEWKPIRENSMKIMHDTADNIDSHYKNTNITRIVGASTAIAGGLLAAGGTIASFFTLGLATPVAGAGIALAVSGGGAAAGASIADIVVARLNLPDAQNQLDTDTKETEELIKIINDIEEIADVIIQRFPHVTKEAVLEILLGAANTVGRGAVVTGHGAAAIPFAVGKGALKLGGIVSESGESVAQFGRVAVHGGKLTVEAGTSITEGTGIAARTARLIGLGKVGAGTVEAGTAAVKGGTAAVRVGNQAIEIGGGIARAGVNAVRVGRVALQGVALVGVALEVVLIPINIAEIVTSGISLYKGSETQASHKLREMAKELKTQMDKIVEIVEPAPQED